MPKGSPNPNHLNSNSYIHVSHFLMRETKPHNDTAEDEQPIKLHDWFEQMWEEEESLFHAPL